MINGARVARNCGNIVIRAELSGLPLRVVQRRSDFSGGRQVRVLEPARSAQYPLLVYDRRRGSRDCGRAALSQFLTPPAATSFELEPGLLVQYENRCSIASVFRGIASVPIRDPIRRHRHRRYVDVAGIPGAIRAITCSQDGLAGHRGRH